MKKVLLVTACLTTAIFLAAGPGLAQPVFTVSNGGAVEGGSALISVSVSASNGTLSYEYDCDGNGAYGDAGDVGPSANASESCGPFGDNGNATVNVQVTDDDGSDTGSTVVAVTNLDPTINSATNDGPIVEGGSATVTVDATDVAADTLSYSFDCDNDSTYEVGPQAGNSTSCSFGDQGTFTVNVQVEDEDTGSASSSTDVTVTNADPTINSVTNDGPIVEGGSATVTVDATDVAADTLSYSFDCDNDSTYEVGPQAGNSTSCSFGDQGTFTVNVQVEDEDTGSASSSTDVTVTNADPTINSVTNDGPIVEGGSATVTVDATDVAADTLSYSFDCDNDSTYEVGPQAGNSTSCFFGDQGTFTVNVQVEDEDTGSASSSTDVTVTNADPTIVTPAADPVVVNEGDTANNSGSFSDVAADPISITADFGSLVDGTDGTWTWSFISTDDIAAQVVNVTATDGDGGSTTDSFTLTVNNVAPTAVDNNYTTLEDMSVGGNVITDDTGEGVDSDPGADVLTVSAFDNPSAGGGTVSIAANGDVTYSPAADFCGPDSFEYTLSDDDGATSTATVSVDVTCVNDAPSFTKGADEAIAEDAGAQSVPGWATALSTGPANESDQTLTAFNVISNDNPGIFLSGPAVDPSTGTLSYEIKPDRTGIANIGITLTDDCGGGAPPASCGTSGVDTSAPQGFKITVAPVNDPPSFSNIGDVTREAGTGAQTVAWASNVVAGPPNESGQSVAFIVTSSVCTPADLLDAGPAVSANGNLLYTPKDGATGSCAISVKLSDNCGLVPGTPSCGGSGVNAESAVVDFTLTLVSALAPIADPQSVSTDGGNPLTIVLTGQDNGGGTPLTFQVLEPVTDQDSGAIVSDTGPFFGTLDTTTPTTNGDGVSADVVYTPDGPFITSAALIATDSISLKNNAQVLSGDIVVNDAGGALDISNNAVTPAGFDVKSDAMDVGNNAEIGGSAFCNSGDYAANCDPLALPAFDPVADPLPPFLVGDVGTTDVSVGKNKTESISPGLYGDLDIGQKGKLIFAPGKYSVRSITTSNKAVLEFSGATEVKVAETMDIGNQSTIGAAGLAGDVVFYVAGSDGTGGGNPPKAVEIRGNNTDTFANIYAPNGTIKFGQNTDSAGAFLAQHVEVLNNATVALDSAFSESPDQFAFEVTDQAGLVSDPAVVMINPDDACRDDGGQIVAIAAFGGSENTDGASSIQITLRGCESTDVPVTFSLIQDGTAGSVTGLPSGPVSSPYEFDVTYTPSDPVPNDEDSFVFSIDNGVSNASATISVNEPPCDAVDVVDGASISTDETNPLTIMLSACDPEGETLVFATTPDFADCATCALSAPAPIVDNRPGFSSANVVLTHSETVATSAFLDFSATSTSGSAVADPGYTIEVEPANLPPNAADDSFSGPLGGAINGNVLGNDTDPNLDSLTAALVGPGPGFSSSFELNPDGSFSYLHNGTQDLLDSFTYEASDGALTNTATVTLTIVAANIEVTVDKSGPTGSKDSLITSSPAGISCGVGCPDDSAFFMTTSDIRLDVSAAPGFLFTGWSGDADCVDGSIIPIADRSCTANFVVDTTTPPPTGNPVLITVLKDGSGDGTVTTAPAGISCGVGCASQSATISGDPRIVLDTVPAAGSVFVGYAGGPSNDCADGVLFATVDTTCSATFNLAGRTLTLQFAGDSGTVTSQPGGISCSGVPCSAAFANGDTVTLSARPNSATGSASWSGPCVEDTSFPNGRKATVLMTADAICTVTFTN